MSATIYDGRNQAQGIQKSIKERIGKLQGRPPGLVAILVGDDAASRIYVEHKKKVCSSVGIQTRLHSMPQTALQSELHKAIEQANADEHTDAILLQLPLPHQLDSFEALNRIKPEKDVDGLTPFSQGCLQWGVAGFVPCTAKAVMHILTGQMQLKGKICAVVGLNPLSGGSIASLLRREKATVITLQKDTVNPSHLSQQADVLISATGHKHLIQKDWLKPGAVVIDVGIHREGQRIYGDVDQQAAADIASFLTPVPGGVGPLTVAMLAENTLLAYQKRFNLGVG